MLSVTKQILVSAPRERVSEYLRDITKLADYEQKVDECKVSYPDSESAIADVNGKYLGLPYKGQFRMVYTRDGGYRSEMLRGPLKKVVGGFHLRSVAGGTVVTHDEQYHIPVAVRPLKPLIRRWLLKTMERELGVIKEGAERLHRARVVQNVDRDVQLDTPPLPSLR